MEDKNRFIRATVMLAAANVIAKILGAVFKIPLTYILKEEGMAIFNTASCIYSMFLTLVISGVPLAASRLISQDMAMKKYPEVKRTVKASEFLLMILGALSSVILFLAAEPLAYSMKDPAAVWAIRVISPSVFFVAWGCAFKSCFQGTQQLLPTAVSQVGEAVIRLLAGYFLALMFARSAPGITAAAATFGVTLGEIAATAFLGASCFVLRIKTKEKCKTSYKEIYSQIAAVAVPLSVCAVTMSLLSMVDVATVRNSLLSVNFTKESAEYFLLQYSSYTDLFDGLLDELKFSEQGARWLWGAYSGYALTVFHLPIGMIATLCVSILPVIAGNLAKKNMTAVRKCSLYAADATLFAAVPAAVLFFVSSGDILKLLFNNSASEKMLALVSPCLIFICMSQLFSAIFNAAGKVYEPFFIQLIGMAIKLLGNIVLVRNPYLNISGAIISSCLAYGFICFAQGVFLRKTFDIRFTKKRILTPFVSAVPMYFVLKLTYQPMCCIFSNDIVSFGASAFAAGVAYLLTYSLFSENGFLTFLKK